MYYSKKGSLAVMSNSNVISISISMKLRGKNIIYNQ
jgi:hypothetical protein